MIAEEFKIEYWEDDEFVITFRGTPIGQTLHRRDADIIVDWLKTAVSEMEQKLFPSPEQTE